MRVLLSSLLMVVLLVPVALAGEGAKLPAEIQTAIEAAKQTNNRFVIEATLKQAAAQYPDFAPDILAQMPKAEGTAVAKATPKPAPKAAEPLIAKLTPATQKPEAKWSGDVQASFEKRSGNTQTEEIRGKVNLERDAKIWRNRVNVEGRYATENQQTINKDYRLRYGLDYKYSQKAFIFGELDYVVDEFSGFDYRLSESLGWGYRQEWPEKNMMLDTRASMGARHYKEDAPGAKTEHEMLILKPEILYKWQMRDNVEFQQKFESAIGQDLTTSKSETSFTYKINSKLGLRVAFEAEHTSDVPAGTKKLETFTSTGLTYKLFD